MNRKSEEQLSLISDVAAPKRKAALEEFREPVGKAALVEAIGSVMSVGETIVSRRTRLADLIERIEAADETLRPVGPDDAVGISRESVVADLRQAAESHTVERCDYYLKRLIKGLTKVKTNGISDINLYRWKDYEDIKTDSLWIEDTRDNSGVHSAKYWGNFIPQIPNQMIRRFTKPGDWVLDTFAGLGTTLIEAKRLGRNCIGIELQESVAQEARELVESEPDPHGIHWHIEVGDSTQVDYPALLAKQGCKSVQLAIMHPPYADIIRFSEDPRDLSNCASVDGFLAGLSKVAEKSLEVLSPGGHAVLVIGDKYAGSEWIPLGFLAMNEFQNLGYKLKSIIVKNFDKTTAKRQQEELWRYRALQGGYYIFKHEYVFVLQKG
jgi:hypothetical protein